MALVLCKARLTQDWNAGVRDEGREGRAAPNVVGRGGVVGYLYFGEGGGKASPEACPYLPLPSGEVPSYS